MDQANDAPPDAPASMCRFSASGAYLPVSSPDVPLAAATFFIASDNPLTTAASAGNRLLDFFTLASGLLVCSVDPERFQFRAKTPPSMHNEVVVKVRFLELQSEGETNRIAVEFQRRQGDSVSFWILYRRVKAFLGDDVIQNQGVHDRETT